jgi:hypothetical protein
MSALFQDRLGRLTVGRNIRLRLKLAKEKSRMEAGSNTSTVVLRVVGGDEKGSLGLGQENDCAGEG